MRIVIILFALALSGCSYLDSGGAARADGVVSYCEANPTEAGRDAVRDSVREEFISEGIELCLGCPGGDTHCVGTPGVKIDDPG